MPILSSDIKLLATQVMDDVPEGGGAPTSVVIEDGKSNNVFKDISQDDRVAGDVSIMKIAAAVRTLNTDTALGVNVIISRPPADPKVSAVLFYTGDFFDRRAAIQNRVESYLSPGEEFSGFLLSNHVAGQSAIQIGQRPGATPPAVNSTLQISGGGKTDYVRVMDVAVETRQYSYAVSGTFVDYEVQVAICQLAGGLKNDYAGTAANRLYERSASAAAVNRMIVADAARYYGITPLAQPITAGAFSAVGESITAQIVPASQTEIQLPNISAAGSSTALVPAAGGTVSLATSVAFAPGVTVYVGNPIYPGSLSIGSSAGTFTDDGSSLKLGALTVGTVNHISGLLTFASSSPTYGGSKTLTFRPAGAPLELADSTSIAVTAETRRANYIVTILPPPAPGTARVSFRSGGNWYEMLDDSAGRMRGADSSVGVGTVDYASGTVAATLGALPDVGSEIVIQWGAKSNYRDRSGTLSAAASIMLQLANLGAARSSVSIAWNDGTARTATDNGSGAISGAGTGTVSYANSTVTLKPTVLPSSAVPFAVSYDHGYPTTETFNAPAREVDGSVALNLAPGTVAGSVELTWNLALQSTGGVPADLWVPQNFASNKTVTDDGLGNLKDSLGVVFGTVNYTTGAVTLHPEVISTIAVPQWSVNQLGVLGTVLSPNLSGAYRNTLTGYTYQSLAATLPFDASALVTAKYRTSSSNTAATENFPAPALSIDLLPTYSETVVPGSVRFSLGGKTYFDRAGGIYSDLDVSTGAATYAGTIDYATAVVALNAWPAAANGNVTVHSLLTSLDGQPVEYVVFRTPVAPISVGSLQLLATKVNGGTINVTANSSGIISGANVSGTVDYQTGVVKVRFGDWVTAAGNEGQVWYDADAVGSDGKIWKPVPVFASTIRYNAVGYTYLPLDASLLGLDPVRLPQDGRVPIFFKGGRVVIGNSKTTIPAGVSNGQTIDCARVRLSRVKVIGADGVTIETGYTANLDAGTVTFTDVSGYSQPVKIEYRIEDMLLVTDVQINGTLVFAQPISHDYAAGESYISSCLMLGDLKARVSIFFDQFSWSGAWSDALIGNAADAGYNDVDNPLIVTNQGAVTERWRIQFTNPTTYNVIGEHLGQIVTGQAINADCSPLNTAAGQPYFTIKAAGFGNGWANGNLIRFNTVATTSPFPILRCVQMGAETVLDDSFELLVRMSVNRD
jgi:hypothetical protein